jgi:hypothetical protein
MKSWNISKSSKFWKIRTLVDRMNLLVQAPHKEEPEEHFTLLQSLNCNEDGRFKNNRED